MKNDLITSSLIYIIVFSSAIQYMFTGGFASFVFLLDVYQCVLLMYSFYLSNESVDHYHDYLMMFHFSDYIMDLKKVRKFHFQYDVFVTDLDLQILENVGLTCLPFPHFVVTKTSIDIRYSAHSNYVYMHVENGSQEKDRYFYDLKLHITDDGILEQSFWSLGNIDMMKIKDLKDLNNPRKITISLGVGIYEGCGTPDVWTKILTCIDDFTPVAFSPTTYSQSKEDLFQGGRFSDLIIVCSDKQQLNVHKCLLNEIPYFKSLLSDNSCKSSKKSLIEVTEEYSVLKTIIQYVYSGRLEEKNVLNWAELHRVSSFFHLNILARHCQLQMLIRTSENIEDIKVLLKFALKCQSRKMIRYLTNTARKIQVNSYKAI